MNESKRDTRKSFKSEIKELAHEWTQNTSIHGLSGITAAKHPFFMILWLLALLASTAYCLYMVVVTFTAYFQYGTLVSVVHHADQPADFPAVTFCNLNPINEARLFMNPGVEIQVLQSVFSPSDFACLLGSYINGSYTYNLTKLELCLPTASYSYILFVVSNYLRRYVANRFDQSNDRQKFGFLLKDMFLNCDYNGKPCSTSDFVQFWHNDYGNCYTFNSGKNGSVVRQTNTPGSNYGLKLDLFVREYLLNIFSRNLVGF
jgi:acid-sensing ion channel 1